MPYTHYDKSKPDGSTGNGGTVLQQLRDNMQALRDMVVAGTLFGWNGTPSGGTSDQPAVVTHSNGSERVRETITWGTTGGADGNPVAIAYDYSADGGSTWLAIGTITYTYNAAGDVVGWTW